MRPTEHDGVHESADQHNQDREDLFGLCVGRHVSEADARQTTGREVECGDVRGKVGQIVDRRLISQFGAELMQPTLGSLTGQWRVNGCDSGRDSPTSQLIGLISFSSTAITYQMQANQWANRENDSISSVRIM